MADTLKSITKLQGKRVLVLGGTSGIGFSIAQLALEYGASVIISSSNQQRLDNAISRLRKTKSPLIANPGPDMVTGKTCDLNDPKTIESNIEDLLRFATDNGSKKLNHVASTAGNFLGISDIFTATPASVDDTTRVRLLGSVMLAKYLVKYMVISQESSFTLTSGTNSWRPNPKWALMAGTGSAVEGLARGFCVDMSPVRVNCVQPGAIRTELFDNVGDDNVTNAMLEKYKKESVLGAVGTPEECAETYLYCMRGSFTTGTVIPCDGGRLVSAAI